MEFLEAIEQLGPARLLKTSFVAYPLVNALHIAAIGALVTSVLLIDAAVLGRIGSLSREAFVGLLRRVALSAFGVAILTGFALFSVRATEYAGNAAFLVKLLLIALAILNFLAFEAQERRAVGGASSAMRMSAIASMALWIGVLVAGRFIGFL